MIEKIEYWIGSVVGIFLALYKLFEWWNTRRKRKINEKILKLFAEDTEHTEILAKNLCKSVADRVYGFRAHNSGGKPTLGKPYYINVIFSFYKDESKNKSKRYNNINVDHAYRNMIIELLEKNVVEVRENSMEEGLLKKIYKDEGIVFGKVYRLSITKTDFYFMSITWFEEPTDSQILEADLIANQISSIYKKHHEK